MNMADIKDRLYGPAGKLYTIAGTATGGAITAAAAYYKKTGDISNWQMYAAVAGAGAVAALGAALKRK